MVDVHLRKLPVGVLLWTRRSEDDDDDDDDEVMPNVLGCRRHIRVRPMPKHGSIKLYANGSQKAR